MKTREAHETVPEEAREQGSDGSLPDGLKEDFYQRAKPRLHRRIGRELRVAGSVVDLGCGSCDLVRFLAAAYGQRVIGVDRSRGSFPRLRRTDEGMRFRCLERDVTRPDFLPERSMDAAVSMWSFHEMEPVEAMLEGILRVLRPGGELLIVDFPRDSLAQTLWNEAYYHPQEVEGFVRRAGFERVRARRVEKGQITWVTGYRPAQSLWAFPHAGERN